MKKIFCVLMMCFFVLSLCGCKTTNDVLRIHIRANSNTDCDQRVKLQVRDEIVCFISPIISKCNSSEDVKEVLATQLCNIEDRANKVLKQNGFLYESSAKINNEYFPTRDYDGRLFPADYYDALIINLGSGEGDNWWCVAYPPLCFVGEYGEGDVRYKSKLLEMINNFFGE